jgi:ATP-dependent helicase/nuclease subunit B
MLKATQLSLLDAAPRLRQRPQGPSLAVLPDAARVEERLVRAARAGGSVQGRVACTVAELERDVLRAAVRAGHAPRVLPPLSLPLLFREIAREHTPRGSPFHRIRNEPGFAGALGELLAVLEQGLLPPEELHALAPALPGPQRDRIEALAALLCAAKELLARRRLGTQAGALAAAAKALRSDLPLPPLLAGAQAVSFESVLDWTPLRIELACALAARLQPLGVPVRVLLPFSQSRAQDLREALSAALRAFESAGARGAAPEIVLQEPDAAGPLAKVLHRLFASGESEEPVPAEARAAPLALCSCSTPAAQAREVARRCRELVDAGAAPDSIAVVARSLAGGVAEELGAALDRLSLPWRERRGRPALPAPPAQLALRLLELVERDFPREELAAILGSRLLWMREPSDALWPHEIARWLRAAHVRDDVSNGGVSTRLTSLAARLRAKAEASSEPGRHGPSPEALARDALRVEEVRRRAQRFIDAVRALPREGTLRAHGAALLGLLSRWELPRRLRASPELPSAGAEAGVAVPALVRAAAAALARDQATLDALEGACAGLSAAAQALGREGASWTRSEFAQLLAGALAEASLRPGGARGAAIQLLELRELPGRSFDHVLITGLVDGQLPARPQSDPLLSDDERRAINRAARRAVFRAPAEGDALVLPPRQIEEPLLFHLGLCSAERTAALFWPRADAQGRELLRSPFVDEAARALGLAEADLGRAPLSPIPRAADCRGEADLLARAALEAFAEPAWRATPPISQQAARALAAEVMASALRPRFERVAQAAFAERERLRAFVGDVQPGRFSGQLGGAALLAAQPHFAYNREAPLSAHQIEEFATCGFRTLGHRLVGIDADEEGEDDLGSKERGTLLHRCLEAFFRRLRREGRLPLRGGPAREAELATLREVADEEMAAFARTEHVGHRALWELRRTELQQTLADLIDAEALSEGEPVEFERRFGFGGEDEWEPLVLPAPDGSAEILVRGTIDRVDRLSSGALAVIDYKSAGEYSLRPRLRPEALFNPNFQLSLYAAVLAAREPGAPIDAAYISLRDARRTRSLRESLGKDAIDLDLLLETRPAQRELQRARTPPPPNLADAVWQRVGEMRRGALRIAPLTCDYCDLKPVCRIVALPNEDDEAGRG